MATPGQMDEKVRPAAPTYSVEHSATPAQLAEKADSQKYLFNEMATPAQLDEKRRGNTAYPPPPPLASAATPAQLSEKAQYTPERPRGRPPPLPPRMSSIPASAPPAYSAADDAKRTELISEQWHSNDPRSSSTHSLVPSESGRDGRRTLLLVYIHGFMGNETSFQSFPAHVHNLLTITLEETHVVHTKIYPRYKSRKAIEFARDDFSTWLEPNENHYTDVVLLGHSMGGILSAEVALQEPQSVATGKPFRHRILGTINFDTPFLGMHPGVIVSGIGSLFRPADPPPGQRPSQPSVSGATSPTTPGGTSGSSHSYTPSVIDSDSTSQISLVQSITSPLATPPPNDPFFNPPFPNDVRLPERKGWSNLLHFVNKHSDGLTSATKSYFMSHLEFGGAMADYPGLKNRYDRLRALEDVDDLARRGSGYQPPVRRIRFTNYYTASTGRPKEPKIPPGQVMGEDGNLKPIEADMQGMSLGAASTSTISVDEHGDGTVTPKQVEDTEDESSVKAQMENLGESSGVQDDFQEPPEMMHIDSMPMEDDEFPEPLATTETGASETPAQEIKPSVTEPSLPPIPPVPTEPEAIDLSLYTDKDSRKIAEKEQKRIMKVYQQAVKDRESAIKDRKKLVEKREKKVRQEREKELKAEEKQRLKEEKEEEKRQATINPAPPKERQASVTSSVKDDKPKRDKKFCMLPPEYGGKRDKCWIRVYMEGVDEVGAHCGLFFPGPQYESLVGDVGARIGKWVEEDATRRAVLAAERG